MPKSHQRYAGLNAASLVRQAEKIGTSTAIFVERLMHDKPHPEHGFRAVMGILSLARRYDPQRLEAACERALTIQALSYSSVNSILKSGLDRAKPVAETGQSLPPHVNIRGRGYYH
ncbi:putative transposase [Ochrobactrum quorumnocens]|uniref:Putative transposase n=1 Tax=Ochrobactrum quorumnocens TaxID=271865 RepID=A0A248UDN5_9HYPH|nr:putative transposase [[Ochrobactrum] quorumnocens]ASV84900.1 putative transposase [[Ochrobactrum] quorumnocens]